MLPRVFLALCLLPLLVCGEKEVLTNYAAAEHGATVVTSSPVLHGVGAIISSKKDKYLSLPCRELEADAPLFFVVRLVTEVSIQYVSLQFLEQFSSFPARWRFSLGPEPAEPGDAGWTTVAEWEPPAQLGEHLLFVNGSVFGRFLLVQLTGARGREKTCTATRLRIYGKTPLERLQESLVQSAGVLARFQQQLGEAEPADVPAVRLAPPPLFDAEPAGERIDGIALRLLRLEMEGLLLKDRLERGEHRAQSSYVELFNRAAQIEGNLALLQAKFDQMPLTVFRLQSSLRDETQQLQTTLAQLRRQLHVLRLGVSVGLGVIAVGCIVALLLRIPSRALLPADDLLAVGGLVSPPSDPAESRVPLRIQAPADITPDVVASFVLQPFVPPRAGADPYSVDLRGDACLALVDSMAVWQPSRPRARAHFVLAPTAELSAAEIPPRDCLVTVIETGAHIGCALFTLGLRSPARWHAHVLPAGTTRQLGERIGQHTPSRGTVVALDADVEVAADAVAAVLERYSKSGRFDSPVSVFIFPERAWCLPHRPSVDPLRVALSSSSGSLRLRQAALV